MDPFTMALIMGGTGLLTSQMNRSAQADANKANAESAAAQTRFSPYTKMSAGSYQARPLENPLGGVMSGAATGLSLSQNYNAADKQGKLMEAQTKYYDRSAPNSITPQPSSNDLLSGSMFSGSNPYDDANFSPYLGKAKLTYGVR